MKHVVINKHSAESCAFRSEELRDCVLPAFRKFSEDAGSHGITVDNMWANMAGHTIFAVVDADNSHVIDVLLRESGLIGYTSSTVYAVESMEAVIEAAGG